MSPDHQHSKARKLRVVLEDEPLSDSLRNFPEVEIFRCADLIAESPECDAVIVTKDHKHLNPSSIGRLARFDLAVLAVVDDHELDSASRLLNRGVHHVLLRSQDIESVLTAILSVVTQRRVSAKLQEDLANAERQLVERETIDQARTIIARRFDVCDEDALSRLRTEARNRRRRLAEVAEWVVEASSIMSDISSQDSE